MRTSHDLLAIVALWDGGLTYHGGLAAGILAGYLYTLRTKTRPGLFADLAAPSLALGYAIARIGCFLNGCCYGHPSDMPWAMRFRTDGGPDITVPSHPVQLYSSAANLLIFLVLIRIEKLRLVARKFVLRLASAVGRREIHHGDLSAGSHGRGYLERVHAGTGGERAAGHRRGIVIALSYRQEASMPGPFDITVARKPRTRG